MSVGLARLVGLEEARRRQLEAALLFTEAKAGYVTGNDLVVLLAGTFESKEVEYLLIELSRVGALRQLSREREGVLHDRFAVNVHLLREALLVAQGFAQGVAKAEEYRARGTTLEVVATLPQGLTLPLGPAPPVSLAAALHRLVVDADNQLVILNPFFETTGLQFLHGALAAAAQRGVGITVVTRELMNEGSPNHRAMLGLQQQLKVAGVDKQLKVFNHHVIDERQSVQMLHAKMVLSDETAAYVGSANLTQYGLGRHLEVGVLLRGPQVATLVNIVAGVLQSGIAKQVEL